MKKITSWLSAMVIAISISSCSSDQELDNVQIKNNEIGFRTFIDKGGSTRATVTDGNNILGFTVTGWWDKSGALMGGENASEPTAGIPVDEYLFNAVDITRRDVGITDWSYSPKRYWPASGIIGGGVKFYAYSPASSKNVSIGLNSYQGSAIEYTVPPSNSKTDAQEDFLFARTRPLTSGAVNLNFLHALSRVRFSARTSNTNLTYVIGGVELINISRQGSIDMTGIPNDGSLGFTYGSTPVTLWTPLDGGDQKLTLDIGDSPINLLGGDNNDKKFYSLHGETGAMMVLPQTTVLGKYDANGDPDPSQGFWIKVSYKAYLNNPTGTYFAGDENTYEDRYFQVLDPASNGTDKIPFTFEIGRPYEFRLEFGSEAGKEITFITEVGTWSDGGTATL